LDLITHLILRIRDYPSPAVDELLSALDKIDQKYELKEKLTTQEWMAVIESRQEISPEDRRAMEGMMSKRTTLSKDDIDKMGKEHFDQAIGRVRLRDGEEQGDISDLIFALLNVKATLWRRGPLMPLAGITSRRSPTSPRAPPSA
jgi:hypothetical protein